MRRNSLKDVWRWKDKSINEARARITYCLVKSPKNENEWYRKAKSRYRQRDSNIPCTDHLPDLAPKGVPWNLLSSPSNAFYQFSLDL
jgi:hypothetical protein